MNALRPSKFQQIQIDRLANKLEHRSKNISSILIKGSLGSGKTALARLFASKIGLEIYIISMKLPVPFLRDSIYETLVKTCSLTGNDYDDDINLSESSVLLLSDLDMLDGGDKFCHDIYRLIKYGIFMDSEGNKCHVSSNLLIIASLSTELKEINLGPEHWITTAFDLIHEVFMPRSPEDLIEILNFMAAAYGHRGKCEVTSNFLSAMQPQLENGLHDLGSIIEKALDKIGLDNDLTDENMYNAVLEDISRICTIIKYRGSTLTIDHISKWIQQFSTDKMSLCLQIIREIVREYYISEESMWTILEKLVMDSAIPKGASVIFCKWQQLGKSSPRICNEIKNLGFWRISGELDLETDEKLWPEIIISCPEYFVIADDFVGTGRTLSSLLDGKNGYVRKLIDKFPNCKIRILLAVGFDGGLKPVINGLAHYKDRVKVYVGKRFLEVDRCFVQESRIFSEDRQRKEFEKTCLDIADKYFPTLNGINKLGYGGLGSLCVFSHTVPNNSLPILWYDDDQKSNWYALFPASGRI